MTIQCRLVEGYLKKVDELQPGDMWFCPWYIEGESKKDHLRWLDQGHGFLSREYVTQRWDKRPPLILRLPDGTDWLVDGLSTSGGGWDISGEAPNITARPSIQSPGFHGWLTNGVLSDDLEGRKYDTI